MKDLFSFNFWLNYILIFAVYIEYIFEEASENFDAIMKFERMLINILPYADDTALIAEKIENLEKIVERVAGDQLICTLYQGNYSS